MTWAAVALLALAVAIVFGKVVKMAGDIDRMERELEELTSAGDGMALLLETLSAEIRAGANSAARMTALADKMDAKEKVWIEKTLANTPAAVEPDLPPDAPPGGEGE